MKIRAAKIQDANAIATLTTELGYASEEADISDRLSGLLSGDEDVVFVAEDEGSVAGWIQAHLSTALESGTRMEIIGLIVSERFRRRRIGKMLVNAAENWAAERGIKTFYVRSNIQRKDSHKFYPALGYAQIKTQAVYRKNAGTV